eukprot:353711-Chlamydomonas_euryale.AAC.1
MSGGTKGGWQGEGCGRRGGSGLLTACLCTEQRGVAGRGMWQEGRVRTADRMPEQRSQSNHVRALVWRGGKEEGKEWPGRKRPGEYGSGRDTEAGETKGWGKRGRSGFDVAAGFFKGWGKRSGNSGSDTAAGENHSPSNPHRMRGREGERVAGTAGGWKGTGGRREGKASSDKA